MDNVIASRTLDTKPVAPALFAHFVLRSANMQPMVDWYTTVLNMHVVKRNDFICFLTYDEEHHRLAIVNIAGLHAPDPRSWGLAHVAYTFRSIGELLSIKVKDDGVSTVFDAHAATIRVRRSVWRGVEQAPKTPARKPGTGFARRADVKFVFGITAN